MSYIKNLDDLIDNLDTMKLSSIIEKSLVIALDLKEYGLWLSLKMQLSGISEHKHLISEFEKLCDKSKIDLSIREEWIEKATTDYLGSRALNDGSLLIKDAKDKIVVWSVYQIENHIEQVKSIIKSEEVPDGLHPVDLYFENQRIEKDKLKMIITLKETSDIYSKIKNYIIGVISLIKINAMDKDEYSLGNANGIIKDNVFIIHGHNEAKWRELYTILKDNLGLVPIELSEQPNQGLTIIEKFEKYAKTCSYAFAIFTPDDIVTKDSETYFQARPNVIFELGWFYAKLGRNKVCILDQESEKSAIFSDLQGVLRIQFKTNVSEQFRQITKELKALGIINGYVI